MVLNRESTIPSGPQNFSDIIKKKIENISNMLGSDAWGVAAIFAIN